MGCLFGNPFNFAIFGVLNAILPKAPKIHISPYCHIHCNMLKDLLGGELYNAIVSVCPEQGLTEIRLRLGLPVAVRVGLNRKVLPFIATKKMIDGVVARATGFSLYSRQDEIKQGFIHYSGGIRIGVAGKGIAEGGSLVGFSEIDSLNIRLPHEIKGCSDRLSNIINNFENTLIVSPPFAGKTTLIRDMARALAKNYDVVIVDERGEIGGGEGSIYDLGSFVDIVGNVPKTLVTEGIIRSMSPEIIVLDELSPEKDMKIVEEISRSGIKLLASVHSDSIERLTKALPHIARHFCYGVLLSNKPSIGSIKSIVRFRGD